VTVTVGSHQRLSWAYSPLEIVYLSKLLFCHPGVGSVDFEAFCQTINSVFYPLCLGFLGRYFAWYKLIFWDSMGQLHSHHFCYRWVEFELSSLVWWCCSLERISLNLSCSSAKAATRYCKPLATNVSFKLVNSLLGHFFAIARAFWVDFWEWLRRLEGDWVTKLTLLFGKDSRFSALCQLFVGSQYYHYWEWWF